MEYDKYDSSQKPLTRRRLTYKVVIIGQSSIMTAYSRLSVVAVAFTAMLATACIVSIVILQGVSSLCSCTHSLRIRSITVNVTYMSTL